MEPNSGKPPVTRLLTAGAKGAERMAHAAGVDRALDEAVEEAIVRALRSPAIGRAIERAIESHASTVELNSAEIAQVVRRALESEAAADIWTEVLASEQAQMLVERVAGAPEIRAAIAEQSAGLITDVGVRLTKLTEALDDAVERIVRRRDPDSETDQAGLATRLTAAGIDLGLLFVAYSLASTALASVIPFVFGEELSLAGGILLGTLGFIAAGAIFASFWALTGQTPGMRFLSIRLTHHGSREISAGVATRRLLALMVSLLPAGLGYFAIARDPSRRGWHDRMTGTEVIYDTIDRRAPHSGPGGTPARARATTIKPSLGDDAAPPRFPEPGVRRSNDGAMDGRGLV
ncbi:MAG: RDD family protein [Solirubrobacteraceae bacterium]